MKNKRSYFIPIAVVLIILYASFIYSKNNSISSCTGTSPAITPAGGQADNLLKLKIPYTTESGKKITADLYVSKAAKEELSKIAEAKSTTIFRIVIAGYG